MENLVEEAALVNSVTDVQADVARPRDGDVVITRESRLPRKFTVRQLPCSAQMSMTVREEAVHLARRFAQEHGVDIWYSNDEHQRLLERYRRISVK